MFGEKKYAMRLWFDPSRLSAYSITPKDVQNAPKRKCGTAWGKLSGDATDLGIRTFGKMNTEDEFNKLIIKNVSGAISCWKMSAKPSWAPK